jgi:hypothetical protein
MPLDRSLLQLIIDVDPGLGTKKLLIHLVHAIIAVFVNNGTSIISHPAVQKREAQWLPISVSKSAL